MFRYEQSTGKMFHNDKPIGACYAGAVGYKNKTEYEGLKNKGPIPRGKWTIGYTYLKHPHLGTYAIALLPNGHNALGRSGFMIHADSVKNPGGASEGCIVCALEVRKYIHTRKTEGLEVF